MAGNPQSWFHRPSLAAWADALGVSGRHVDAEDEPARLDRLFQRARELGAGDTNVFGLRLQRDSFAFFFETLRRRHASCESDLAAFERSFGATRFIHLSRADKVAQAVSCVRAQQSGLWHVRADGSELERTAPHSEPRYDYDAIAAEVDLFTQADKGWDSWFGAEGIEPLRLSYTQVGDDPTAVTRDVLRHLGLDPSHSEGVVPGVRKLADATSDEWIARFRSE